MTDPFPFMTPDRYLYIAEHHPAYTIAHVDEWIDKDLVDVKPPPPAGFEQVELSTPRKTGIASTMIYLLACHHPDHALAIIDKWIDKPHVLENVVMHLANHHPNHAITIIDRWIDRPEIAADTLDRMARNNTLGSLISNCMSGYYPPAVEQKIVPLTLTVLRTNDKLAARAFAKHYIHHAQLKEVAQKTLDQLKIEAPTWRDHIGARLNQPMQRGE